MVMSGLESSFAKQVAYAHCVPPRAPAVMFKRREVSHGAVDNTLPCSMAIARICQLVGAVLTDQPGPQPLAAGMTLT